MNSQQPQQQPIIEDENEEESEEEITKIESDNKIDFRNAPLGLASELIQHPIRLNIIGKSRMGKTTLAVRIICQCIMKDVQMCFATCPTFWVQPQLKPLRDIPGAFHKGNVFTQIDDEVFEKIYQWLEAHPQIPTFLFVDDAAAERATNQGNKGSFSRLCLASPHLNLTIVGVFQRGSSCSPSLRDNSEGIIIFKPTKVHDVKMILDECNPNPELKTFDTCVRKALNLCWSSEERFAFIYRAALTGNVEYFCGFRDKIQWPCGF